MALSMINSRKAALKPISGDTSKVSPIFVAWPQSTPLVSDGFVAINWFMSPTPMMEPIRVCELDDGSPKFQVPQDGGNQERQIPWQLKSIILRRLFGIRTFSLKPVGQRAMGFKDQA